MAEHPEVFILCNQCATATVIVGRFLTPEENQDLTDLAEDIAQQMLGPDWKERQEQRRAALNEKIAKQ